MKRILVCVLGVAALGAAAWADPPARVGRLSYLDGSVTLNSGPATLNYPLTTGNQLSTAAQSRAEVQIGSAAVQLASDTGLTFETLDDQAVQIRLDKGRVSIQLRRLGPDQSFEIDTPTASISLTAPGQYRVDQDESGGAVVITREGDAQVTGGQSAFHVGPGQKADIPASGPDAYQISSAPPPDSWDQWVSERDSRQDRVASTRYVSSEMDGVGDLDEYGSWSVVAGYGPVWFPTTVAVGWAPYSFGHWVWVDPWGWTWVDNEPWGFAPFHYGRWAFLAGGWCWVPGRIVARPVYAPALVRWVGGSPLRGNPPDQARMSWVPLRPRQAFHPWYSASGTYLRAVNGAPVRPTYEPGVVARTPDGPERIAPQRPMIANEYRPHWVAGGPRERAPRPWVQPRPSYASGGAAPPYRQPADVRQAPGRFPQPGPGDQNPELWRREGR